MKDVLEAGAISTDPVSHFRPLVLPAPASFHRIWKPDYRKPPSNQDTPIRTLDRGIYLAIANMRCSSCHGCGLKEIYVSRMVPCKCVWRAVFQACHKKFRQRGALGESHEIRRVQTWSRPLEEYAADFTLIAKRTLGSYDSERIFIPTLLWDIFEMHMIEGVNWRVCADKLKIDRGNFFHHVYRIQEELGRVFFELKPYALYPLNEYFSSSRCIVTNAG